MTLQKLNLKYDTDIKIATGASRKSTKWVNADMKWSELAARLSVPQRTSETVGEYQRMPKPKKDVCKDEGREHHKPLLRHSGCRQRACRC